MKTLDKNKIKNKKIIYRADLNVPVLKGKITDYSRIDSITATLQELIRNKNKIFIVTHFGRPGGTVNKELSIKFLCEELKIKLDIPGIHFLETFNSKEIKNKQIEMNYGEVCLFENVRFYHEEESNEINFSKKLSSNFEVYINDAFSSSHRSHSSIVGIPKFIPSFAGYNFTQEITNLNYFLEQTKKPNLAIIGGSKISTKIKVLNNLIRLFDSIVIGGAMANTFLLAKKIKIGNSLCETEYINIAQDILTKAKKENCKVILPIDVVCATSIEDRNKVVTCNIEEIPGDKMVLDVGLKTINLIIKQITLSKSVIWNGPLGVFEYKPFDYSSIKIANQIKYSFNKNSIKSLAGGGDTLSAINLANARNGFTYLSTAGGAFLEWLEGNKSPGYIALKNSKN